MFGEKANIHTFRQKSKFTYQNLSRSSSEAKFTDEIDLDDDIDKTMHIKGQVRKVLCYSKITLSFRYFLTLSIYFQMILVPEWGQMLFLACPMMKDLSSLIWSGLFVNELSMHDYSRDIMLATTQEQIELKMALSAAEKKGQVGHTLPIIIRGHT